jgi:hypothetical protein
MRRSFGLALAALLALTLLAGPAAADDVEVVAGGEVLAVEDAPPGPEPMDRTDPDNKARELAGFEDPDVPWTYYAAFLLSVLGLAGLALLIGIYYLRVQRPSRESSGSS